MTLALKVSELCIVRRGFRLGPINLEITPGLTLGLIGPNGVGKTTFILGILGLMGPDSGNVEVCGLPVRSADAQWKQKLGVVLDGQSHYERLTVKENLKLHAKLRDSWDSRFEAELLEKLQLSSSKLAKHLSKGDRQKLSLVAALAHRPALLILDEATSGLDPVVRSTMLDVLLDAMQSGDMSILMATHLIADVAALADHVAFMQNGQVNQISEKDFLLDSWRRVSFQFNGLLPKLSGTVKRESEEGRHLVTTCRAGAMLAELDKLGATDIEPNRMGLEDIAVQILTGGAP